MRHIQTGMAQDILPNGSNWGLPLSVAGMIGVVSPTAGFDHPHRVDRLAVLDILPIDVVWTEPMPGSPCYWPWVAPGSPNRSETDPTAAAEAVVDNLPSKGFRRRVPPKCVRLSRVLRDRNPCACICEDTGRRDLDARA